MISHATNPDFRDEPHADARVHGTATCPHRCSTCPSGLHHWIEDGYTKDEYGEGDPRNGPDTDPESQDDEHIRAVKAFDREHGTEHLYAFFGCKHCGTWA
jgi:hypothetical protein